jgi:RNA polymerase sigma factor (TIGR02999 family)
MDEITKLLQAWRNGDKEAPDQLMRLVDPELKKIAHHFMRNERAGHILQTTALVNEALVRLIRENIEVENRRHFYGILKRRMRQVLIEIARGRPRGEHIKSDEAQIPYEKAQEVLTLERALTKLGEMDHDKLAIIEYRFFIGLTHDEIAQLLGISATTVQREWRFARSWLKTEMTGES